MSPEFWASWLVEPVPWWRGLQVDEAVLLFDLRAFLKFGKAGKGKRNERGIALELIQGDWLPISYLSIPPSCLKIISLLRRIPLYYPQNFRGFENHVTIRCQGLFTPLPVSNGKAPGTRLRVYAEDSIKYVQIVKFDSIPRMIDTFLYARIRTFRPCQGTSIQLT